MKEELSAEVQADLANIIGLIDEELGEPPLPRPEGFGITVKEYMRAKGCSEGVARKFLAQMVENGKFKKKIMVDGRGNAPMVYYPAQEQHS